MCATLAWQAQTDSPDVGFGALRPMSELADYQAVATPMAAPLFQVQAEGREVFEWPLDTDLGQLVAMGRGQFLQLRLPPADATAFKPMAGRRRM